MMTKNIRLDNPVLYYLRIKKDGKITRQVYAKIKKKLITIIVQSAIGLEYYFKVTYLNREYMNEYTTTDKKDALETLSMFDEPDLVAMLGGEGSECLNCD